MNEQKYKLALEAIAKGCSDPQRVATDALEVSGVREFNARYDEVMRRHGRAFFDPVPKLSWAR